MITILMLGAIALTAYQWIAAQRTAATILDRLGHSRGESELSRQENIRLQVAMRQLLDRMGAHRQETLAARFPAAAPSAGTPIEFTPEGRRAAALRRLGELRSRELKEREKTLWDLSDWPAERASELQPFLVKELAFEPTHSPEERREQIAHAIAVSRLWVQIHRDVPAGHAAQACASFLEALTDPIVRGTFENQLRIHLPEPQHRAWVRRLSAE